MLKKTILVTFLLLSQSLHCMLRSSSFEIFAKINNKAEELHFQICEYLLTNPAVYDNRTLELSDRNKNFVESFINLQKVAGEQEILMPIEVRETTLGLLNSNTQNLALLIKLRPSKQQVRYFFGQDIKFFHECEYKLLPRHIIIKP